MEPHEEYIDQHNQEKTLLQQIKDYYNMNVSNTMQQAKNTFYDTMSEVEKNNILNAADINQLAQEINAYFYNLSTPGGGNPESRTGFKRELPYEIDGVPLTSSDTDALQHFFGSAITQDKYGTVSSLLGGLVHEVEGVFDRHTAKSIGADLINNLSGLWAGSSAPKFDTDELLRLLKKNLLSSYNQGEPLTIDEKSILDGMLQYGLDWTMDPPKDAFYPNTFKEK